MKKCRVYKPASMQMGGEQNSKIIMTQDSQVDPVPQEKANNFLTWLRKTSQEKRLDEELETKGALYNEFNEQGSIKSQNAIGVLQGGGSMIVPGVQSNDYLKKKDNNIQFFQDAYNQNDPNIFENLQIFTDSLLPVAQDGLNYPDNNIQLIPEIDTLTPEVMTKLIEENNRSMINVMDPAQYINEPVQEFEPGSTDDPFNKQRTSDRGAFGSYGMDPRNTNIAQGLIAGIRVGEGIFNYRNRAEQERELRNRFSNVFETHGVAGADRGDYMVNVPGIGDPLKPDQHTRMGYNTKVAQDGIAVQDNTRVNISPYATSQEIYPYGPEDFAAINAYIQNKVSKDIQNYGFTDINTHKNYALKQLKNSGVLWPVSGETYSMKGLPDYPIKQQGGQLNVDDEITLTEEQINNLIKQGYKLEYLD